MGFRSTFTTESYGIIWPDWFKEKYQGNILFPEKSGGISAKFECKTYMTWESLDEDIQKSIDWADLKIDNFILVYLHECGGITRVQISKENILYSEPDSWKNVEGVTHDYCYKCSDVTPTDVEDE